ncbi:MAG: vanadium-dependent haloperoxidase [Vicinamibacterales bacterium]
MTTWCRRLSGLAFVAVLQLSMATNARADVVLAWNEIAVNAAVTFGANPFQQARFAAIVQLAVFEAVNSIKGEYQPYLLDDGEPVVVAPRGASAEAAAIAAAHRVLSTYFSSNATLLADLDAARASSLAAIPGGQAKDDGIAVGEAAAAAMTGLRASDGSSPLTFYEPGPPETGIWQPTPSCPVNPATGLRRGVLLNWRNVTPFGIPGVAEFMPEPPPELTSNRYLKDYNDVMRVGSSTADLNDRPQDRADVARFYASLSPAQLLNSAARQLATAKGHTFSENARTLALLNMASSDSLVVSFATKYHYLYWRPETAIHAGDSDGIEKTVGNPSFVPYIATPCFPSYPSNHASGTNGGTEVLRRIFGEGGHDITLSNPTAGLTFHYSTLNQIANNVDDARVYGGIHYWFDQEVGNRLGRAVATYVYKNNLQRANGPR